MKLINKIKNTSLSILVAGVLFASCNKAPEAPVPNVIPANPASGSALSVVLASNADDSLFNKLVIRGGMQATLANLTNRYTLYVPNNAAMRNFVNAASGGLVPVGAPDATHVAFINTSIPVATAGLVVSYNISPLVVSSGTITSNFPNFAYPSIINPSIGTASPNPFARLDNYPSKRTNGAWLNNIPLVPGLDVPAANGIIHHTAAVSTPPSVMLWSRIGTDADMTYLRAAVRRADSAIRFTPVAQGGFGFAAGDYTTAVPAALNQNSVESLLNNFGPNVTVFAPTNAAFQALVSNLAFAGYLRTRPTPYTAADTIAATAVAAGAVAAGPNFLYTNNVPTNLIQAVVAYHVLGDRAFSVNLPTSATNVKTFLNTNALFTAHPGVSITATFTGPSVTAATVKGVGNATAFSIPINPTPNPGGTSDQHFVNGVLHKLNGVLLPQ